MENQDKIYDLFKNASQKAENKDFPEMEKIWSQVEQKLDTKVLTKKSNQWKKIAVVASIVAVISIGYQLFTSEKNKTIIENKKSVIDSTKNISAKPILNENIIINEDSMSSSIIKEEAKSSLEKRDSVRKAVTLSGQSKLIPTEKEEIILNVNPNTEKEKENPNYILRGNVFDAIGVHHTTQKTTDNNKTTSQTANPPLLVIDGKAVKSTAKKLTDMNPEELEDVVYLKEPLYIINGVHYSEKEMFGPNPTSPYAPLDQQEIIKLVILQDKEAIEKYGKKGEKGVVIITTKNAKPVIQK